MKDARFQQFVVVKIHIRDTDKDGFQRVKYSLPHSLSIKLNEYNLTPEKQQHAGCINGLIPGVWYLIEQTKVKWFNTHRWVWITAIPLPSQTAAYTLLRDWQEFAPKITTEENARAVMLELLKTHAPQQLAVVKRDRDIFGL